MEAGSSISAGFRYNISLQGELVAAALQHDTADGVQQHLVAHQSLHHIAEWNPD